MKQAWCGRGGDFFSRTTEGNAVHSVRKTTDWRFTCAQIGRFGITCVASGTEASPPQCKVRAMFSHWQMNVCLSAVFFHLADLTLFAGTELLNMDHHPAHWARRHWWLKGESERSVRVFFSSLQRCKLPLLSHGVPGSPLTPAAPAVTCGLQTFRWWTNRGATDVFTLGESTVPPRRRENQTLTVTVQDEAPPPPCTVCPQAQWHSVLCRLTGVTSMSPMQLWLGASHLEMMVNFSGEKEIKQVKNWSL